jgi:N-acetylmuramidase
MNEFATPKPGSGGINLRSQPVVDATTKVGALAEGARIELEQAGVDWHSCQVYVSTQGTQLADGFISLRPEWFQINLRLSPVISDANDIGDLVSGQQLELVTTQDDWLIARVFVSAQFTDLTSTSNPTPNPPPAPLPGTGLISPDELRQLRLTPAQIRVPPVGFSQDSIQAAHIWKDYGGVIEVLAAKTGIDVGQAVAVVAIESGGHGFGQDGRMVIRFEVHVFWSQWGKNNPDQFNALFAFNSGVDGQSHVFRANPNAPWQNVHTRQASEWDAFTLAQQLNERAAKLSISMGLAQVMGFNHKRLGYATAEAMFDALNTDERLHLLGMFSFIVTGGNLVRALQQNDLVTFARGYNGSGQENYYADRIAAVQTAFAGLVVQRALKRSLGSSLWSAALPVSLPAPKTVAPSKKPKPKRTRN